MAVRGIGSICVGLGYFGLLCFHLAHGKLDEAPTASGTKHAAMVEDSLRAVGSASCSARGCHGGIEPWAGKTTLRNEYTTWLHNDPHAGAFRVLSNAASLQIAELLKLDRPPMEHERCLACHVAPSSEATTPMERHYGVGCEACHGPAEKWLTLHSKPEWKDREEGAKKERGMTPTGDPRSLAEQCVGCHVGAGPSASTRLRDVNHDLIAAGHPRLNFEFTAYLDNLPKHWKNKQRSANQRAASYLTGQLVTAHAALELLASRAGRAADERGSPPWPEFAEYDCFSCHHDLQAESWRRHRANRHQPGALLWSAWYVTVPRALGGMDAPSALHGIRITMEAPFPAKQDVVVGARQAAARLKTWLQSPRLFALDRKEIQQSLTADFLRGLTDVNASYTYSNWDALAQLYLALAALNRAENERIEATLKALDHRLAFPRNIPNVRYESPKGQELNVDALVKLLRSLMNERSD